MSVALQNTGVIVGSLAGEQRASLACSLLWSGTGAQEFLVESTYPASPADIGDFARFVSDAPRLVRPGATAIGEVLLAATWLLARISTTSARQVIEVIGDRRSNERTAPGPVRDQLVGAGVTVNGRCLSHEEPDVPCHDEDETEVIGGPGSFALSCPHTAAFADAMLRKFLRELVS